MGEVARISRWKIWWSYISEVLLEHTSSIHNENLYVVLNRGRLQLCTDDAIYSYDDLYDNFKYGFDLIDLEVLTPGAEVLVLGTGLASIPYILEKKMHKHYHYDCVEIDEEVAYLCSKYALSRLSSNVEMFITDAAQYVSVVEKQYDMICIDIFQSSEIPSKFQSQYFLEQIKNMCKPNAIVLLNRLGYTEEDINKSKAYFENVFVKAFPNGVIKPIKGNYILINDKNSISTLAM